MRRKKILIGVAIVAIIFIAKHSVVSVFQNDTNRAQVGRDSTKQTVNANRKNNVVAHLLEISTPFGSLTVF